MRLLVPLVALLAGCPPQDQFTYDGYTMRNFFPFDGVRTWEFTSTDTTLRHHLVASMGAETEMTADGVLTHEIRYDLVCVDPGDETCAGSWVRSLVWSATASDGVMIHALHTDSVDLAFEPPIALADGSMLAGETVTSGPGDAWTATFVGVEACPVLWTTEWDTCARLRLEGSGEGADELVGEYWAVTSFNVVAMELGSDSGQWQLSYATYEPAR